MNDRFINRRLRKHERRNVEELVAQISAFDPSIPPGWGPISTVRIVAADGSAQSYAFTGESELDRRLLDLQHQLIIAACG